MKRRKQRKKDQDTERKKGGWLVGKKRVMKVRDARAGPTGSTSRTDTSKCISLQSHGAA